ncbi:MAG: hypothetical protein FWG12_05085 [Holophagaceae bacterium]|nr:hypothetical protein [Holophagaceae bacterium]
MKYTWCKIALGMMALLLGYEAAVAQGANFHQSASIGQKNDLSAESVIALAFRADALKQAFLSGIEDQIQQAADGVDLLKKEYGIYDLTPLVEAMSSWALELGHSKRVHLGKRVLSQISRWEPQHPTLLAAEVKLMRLEGTVGYFQSLSSAFRLYQMRLEDPDLRYFFILKNVAWARFMATVVLWVTALLLALRYNRFFGHLLERPFINFMPNRHAVAVVAGLILALPVLVGLGPSFCAVMWLFLLVPILTSTEMKIAIFCILVQLVHPGLVVAERFFVSETPFQTSFEPLQLQPQLIPMELRPQNNLAADDQKFILGWDALQSRDWVRAESIFSDLSNKSYEKAATLNNLGVALQRQEKNDAAMEAFVKAGSAGSGTFEPSYNQAILHFVNLDIDRAERKLTEARNNDPASFRAIFSPMSSIASILEHITIAMPIRDNPARGEALANMYNEMYGDVPVEPDQSLFGTWTIIWIIWPLVGVVAVIVRRNTMTGFSRYYLCSKCGKSFLKTQEVDSDANTCPQCFHIFVLKDAPRNDSQRKKILQISLYKSRNKWVTRIIGTLAPGGDKFFSGSSFSGFITFALLAFSFGVIIHSSGDILFPGQIIPDPSSLLSIVGFFMIGVLYLQSWYKLFFPKREG